MCWQIWGHVLVGYISVRCTWCTVWTALLLRPLNLDQLFFLLHRKEQCISSLLVWPPNHRNTNQKEKIKSSLSSPILLNNVSLWCLCIREVIWCWWSVFTLFVRSSFQNDIWQPTRSRCELVHYMCWWRNSWWWPQNTTHPLAVMHSSLLRPLLVEKLVLHVFSSLWLLHVSTKLWI